MADNRTKPRTRAPLWALAIGMIAVAGSAFLLVRLFADQLQAFALGVPGSQTRLLIPLAGGEIVSTLAVWVALWAAFRSHWDKHRSQFQLWFIVILATSMATTGILVVRSVHQARAEAARVAAEIARVEKAAIDGAWSGFPDNNDSALVDVVFREMRGWADPIRNLRDTTISRDPDGEWEAVCGQVSFKDGEWAGFVSRRSLNGRVVAVLEQDGFTEAQRNTCRPIVDKYVGVDGVDVAAAVAAMKALGCSNLDINYWENEKTFCHGRVARSTP